MDTTNTQNPTTAAPKLVQVNAEAWCGNYRPWRGVVLVDGCRVFVTGGCKTHGRALAAAREAAVRFSS